MQEARVADVAEKREVDLVGRRHVLEHDCFEIHGGQKEAAKWLKLEAVARFCVVAKWRWWGWILVGCFSVWKYCWHCKGGHLKLKSREMS